MKLFNDTKVVIRDMDNQIIEDPMPVHGYLKYTVDTADGRTLAECNNKEAAELYAAANDLRQACEEALPLLIRLGDFIANADNRCEVIGKMKDALSKSKGEK
jgi:hypothetical protein